MLEHPADEIPNRLFDLLSPKTLLLAGIGALPGAGTEIVVVAMAAFQLSGACLHLPPAPAAHEASQLPQAALVLPLAPRPAVHRAPCEIHERARNVGGDGRGYPLFPGTPLERPRLPVATPAWRSCVRLGDGAFRDPLAVVPLHAILFVRVERRRDLRRQERGDLLERVRSVCVVVNDLLYHLQSHCGLPVGDGTPSLNRRVCIACWPSPSAASRSTFSTTAISDSQMTRASLASL